jgi:hypothetical protein
MHEEDSIRFLLRLVDPPVIRIQSPVQSAEQLQIQSRVFTGSVN